MPSVRVRRSNYSALGDTDRPRNTLTSLFIPPHQPAQPLQPSPSGNDLAIARARTTSNSRDDNGAPTRQTLRRPPSKVHHHCTRFSSLQPLRPPRLSQSQDSLSTRRQSQSPPRTAPRRGADDALQLQGRQADLRLEGGENGQSSLIGSVISLNDSDDVHEESEEGSHHHDDIVEHLDCIDPQVAMVSNLTNAANSLLIPPLSFYSRRPVVILSPPRATQEAVEKEDQHGDSLDRHVDDVLNRPSKFRRTMKGVWSFLKTPMGIIVGIYGFLVVFWGAAIVIFLLKIINLHNANTQGFWVELSSQIENGLFTVTGIGLIPSRVLDTWRIYRIWHYKRKTQRLRRKAGLPQLYDLDDLPDPVYDVNYVHVLTEKEQAELHKQQVKFQHNQTWYRAHGTETHRAFPINIALLICLFIDGNSIFQIMLCTCMWSMNRFQRPAWTTGSLIPLSCLCGIAAGIFIWKGGQRTKRTEKVEEKLRAALAMEYPDYRGLDTQVQTTSSSEDRQNEKHGNSGQHSEHDNSEMGPVIEETMTVPADVTSEVPEPQQKS